jgi:hypothetical protein
MAEKYTFPIQHACFECHKAFKRYICREDEPREQNCPECGGTMWEMGRTFKAPKQDDVKQWSKVEKLVRNGITFHSTGSHGLGKFPRLLNEVGPFIERVQRRSERKGERLLRKISKKGG